MKRQLETLAIGDNLIHKEVYISAYRKDGSYRFDSIYTPVKNFINKADIRIVNQETVFIDNVTPHASNHALDEGLRGLRVSLNDWREDHPELKIAGIYEKGVPRKAYRD